MSRYIALLRGINVSGKNKIAMSELKVKFTDLGFSDVLTYLNSGNVVFSSNEMDKNILADKISKMILNKLGFVIPVCVILQEELEKILNSSPNWWGTEDKDIYDNMIFVMPPVTAKQIADKIGEPTKELEKIFIYENVIFWSFDRQKYSKANWWKKTAGAGIGELITIRTANTLKKIVGM